MDDNRITLTLEGLVSDEGHVRLSVLRRQLRGLEVLLTTGEKLLTGEVLSYYRVIEVRYASPLAVVVERVPRNPHRPQVPVIAGVLAAVQEIDEETVPDASREIVAALTTLVRPVGHTLRSSTLSSNGTAAHLTQQLARKIRQLREPEMSEMGEVKGRLERINFHASANTFHVYPMIGPKLVACHFPPRLTAAAEAAINRQVMIDGELMYKSGARFPYAVEVIGIEVLSEKVPSLTKMRGVAPDATGNLTAEEFVWRSRNEW